MKFILFDKIEGTILGLDDINQYKEDWYSLSDEGYEFILSHNGEYIVDVSGIAEKINEYDEDLKKISAKEIESIDYAVVEIENLKRYENSLSFDIAKQLQKNSAYCTMFIQNGIVYEFEDGTEKQYTFKIEDQINFAELNKLYNDGVLTEDCEIPFKAKEDEEYELLKMSVVLDIYNKLIKNKLYNLLYLRQLNAYTKTLTSADELNKIQYEMILPDSYQSVLDEQMKVYENL